MNETVDDARARVALVTRANRGIGAAIAVGLVRGGWTVAVGSPDLDHGAVVAGTLVGLGSAQAVRLDVTDSASVEAAVDEVLARSGRIDPLVNNAGGHDDAGVRPSEVGDAERSVEEGADTPIWLATLPDDGPTGGCFDDRLALEW